MKRTIMSTGEEIQEEVPDFIANFQISLQRKNL